LVGRIAGAYGVKGWLRVETFAGHGADSVLLNAKHCLLVRHDPKRPIDLSSAAAIAAVSGFAFTIVQARLQGTSIVVQFAEVLDRNQAEALGSQYSILVARSEFPKAAADEFYWVDLIGSTVSNQLGVEIGTVDSMEDFGAHAILQVGRHLIPFVDAYVISVDVIKRTIVVDWDESYSD
jgi:16S rRNA processing protein RimM